MNSVKFTPAEQLVLSALKKEHLTTFELLKKVDNIPMILSLYNILDKLNQKGVLKTYVKKDTKYHYAA